MAAPKRREALAVFWRSPQDQPCSLTPLGDYGVIEVDIFDGQANIHGRECLHTVNAHDEEDVVETRFSEVEITVPLVRCEINWIYVVKKETDAVERSVYFKR